VIADAIDALDDTRFAKLWQNGTARRAAGSCSSQWHARQSRTVDGAVHIAGSEHLLLHGYVRMLLLPLSPAVDAYAVAQQYIGRVRTSFPARD